jgi:hypothetical protein
MGEQRAALSCFVRGFRSFSFSLMCPRGAAGRLPFSEGKVSTPTFSLRITPLTEPLKKGTL